MRKIFPGVLLEKSAKTTRLPDAMSSAAPIHLVTLVSTQQGLKHNYAMIWRRFAMPCSFSLQATNQKIIYITNAVESINRVIRKAIYLAIENASKK